MLVSVHSQCLPSSSPQWDEERKRRGRAREGKSCSAALNGPENDSSSHRACLAEEELGSMLVCPCCCRLRAHHAAHGGHTST
ncbi:hypothetical protein EYF80_056448 [Liparis tanakae]|uniref:Uncharacterized protein n=1 Tax=Liparis tanakae TaxID=230148 RepID=A0A4Z2EYH1_9TELE|nr:hypothetical protein EYF80_056448 [Liparis tanakae]